MGKPEKIVLDDAPCDRELPGDRYRQRQLIEEHRVAIGVIQRPGAGQQQCADREDRAARLRLEHEPEEDQQEDSGEPAGDALQQRDEPRALHVFRGWRLLGDHAARAQQRDEFEVRGALMRTPPRASGA